MYYTYIIQSQKDRSFYTGSTHDLKTRLQNHNSGKVKYTCGKRPFTIAWYCAFNEKMKAYTFEKYLKTGSGIAFARKHLINNLKIY
jgi:predicted GIY-YIG superfamily endonuclease